MLMQNGANVNNLTKDGFCPLRIAAQENHVAIAESLIRHRADTEIWSVISRTPLLRAAVGNFFEFFKLLVENDADVNAQDLSGWKSLHYAIYHKNMSMVNILVNEDTNLELRSFEFGTPMHHVLLDGEYEIFELLISFGANVDSLTPDKDSLLHSVSTMLKS